MKKLLAILFCTALLVGALAVPAGATVAYPEGVCDTTGMLYKVETGDMNSVILPAGTVFCVKAANNNSGKLTADGITSLYDYVTWLNNGGQHPDVSHYVVYSEPPPPSWSSLSSGSNVSCKGLSLTWGYTLQAGASPDDLDVYLNGGLVDDAGSYLGSFDTSYTFTFYWKDVKVAEHGPYSGSEPSDCEPLVCDDETANNYGGPLPCTYDPPPVCEDPLANNVGGPLPCTYDPPPVCEDKNALNYKGSLPCEYPQPEPKFRVDCTGVYSLFEGNEFLLHEWTDPYKLETWEPPTTNAAVVIIGPPVKVFEEPDYCLKVKECEMKPLYWQDRFLKEGQPPCYLVTWDQRPDGTYIPAATRSQLCNCGWIADKVSGGGFVYIDCRGTYWYMGEVWSYGKPDMVMPHWEGTCAMGGC